MANKKQEFAYLNTTIPTGQKAKKSVRLQWGGLNRRYIIDTGELSMEKNISTSELPHLVPSQKRTAYKSGYQHPIGLYGFDDFLLCIYREGAHVKMDYIKADGTIYTGSLKISGVGPSDDYPRCIVQFNVYDTPTDVLNGKYVKKLLVFPDKLSMDFNISENFKFSQMTDMPDIQYACVHLSRVFGVDNDRIYASGYNDYANWNLDTADETLANNAWCSPAQSNTKANGDFTGITVFQNHIICFKHDFMHELYNNKNPFRIQDIFAEGAIDNRTIQDVDGRLIFVSDDGVKIYTGSNPRSIGGNLNIDSYKDAVAGTDGGYYYLYCKTKDNEPHIFVYDVQNSMWSEQECHSEVLSFAHNKNGMYMLCADGRIYQLDTGLYSHEWCFETDITLNRSADIKHIDKIQIVCDMGDDSRIAVYALYDGEEFNENTSHMLCERFGTGRKVIRVKPRMTADYSFKLHFEGFGYVKIYQMEVVTSDGGELFV